MQTREQLYATEVYRLVSSEVTSEDKQKYGSMAHKLPALIRSAGLAQALAFADTRTDAEKKLLRHLEGVLRTAGALAPEGELLAHSREAELDEYMLLTEHALAALLWFKRYAQSVLDVTADAGGGT